jgi:ATP-dependent Clp protease adaptor protein ClpS
MSSKERPDGDPQRGVAVAEAEPKVRQPPLFRVLLLNDDYTPMEFVVDILERFFAMNRNQATRVMLEVHTRGTGVCGAFTYEIAETKVAQVISYARENQHPLMCTMEDAQN